MCHGLPCFRGTPEQFRVAMPRRVQRGDGIDYLHAGILQTLVLLLGQETLEDVSNAILSLSTSF